MGTESPWYSNDIRVKNKHLVLKANTPNVAQLAWQLAMSVFYKIFIKDFKLLKFLFFVLTSFFLYGELRLFFVEKPSFTSDGIATLAPINYPEILICKIDGYDKEQLKFHGYETSFRYATDEFL